MTALHTASSIPTGVPKSKRTLAKEATRKRIVDASRQLFSTRRSYESITVRDIVAAMGMSTGALYSNFTTKAELLAAVLEPVFAERMRLMRNADSGKTLTSALRSIFRHGYAFDLKHMHLLATAYEAWWQNEPEVVAIMEDANAKLLELFSQKLEKWDFSPESGTSHDCARMLCDTYSIGHSYAQRCITNSLELVGLMTLHIKALTRRQNDGN